MAISFAKRIAFMFTGMLIMAAALMAAGAEAVNAEIFTFVPAGQREVDPKALDYFVSEELEDYDRVSGSIPSDHDDISIKRTFHTDKAPKARIDGVLIPGDRIIVGEKGSARMEFIYDGDDFVSRDGRKFSEVETWFMEFREESSVEQNEDVTYTEYDFKKLGDVFDKWMTEYWDDHWGFYSEIQLSLRFDDLSVQCPEGTQKQKMSAWISAVYKDDDDILQTDKSEKLDWNEPEVEFTVPKYRVRSCGITYIANLRNGFAYVAAADDDLKKAKIKSKVKIGGKKYPVTIIGGNAFRKHPNIKSVIIPSSVKEIEDEAFYDSKIRAFKIPKSVKEIGKSAIGFGTTGKNASYMHEVEWGMASSVDDYGHITVYRVHRCRLGPLNGRELIMYVNKGSAAEKYAKEEKIKYIYQSDVKKIRKAEKMKTKLKGRVKREKAVLAWKKVKKATGYVIYRASSQKGEYKKVRKIRKAKITKWTSGKLKKGKRYYFRIRPYKKISGKMYYGKWSNIRKVRVK